MTDRRDLAATESNVVGGTDSLFFPDKIKPVPHVPTPEMLAAAMRADQDGMPASMKTIWMVMWGAYRPPPETNLVGVAANKADAILRVVRKMIAGELAHAEKPQVSQDRLELDFLLAELLGFSTRDVDKALLIVRRRASPSPKTSPTTQSTP